MQNLDLTTMELTELTPEQQQETDGGVIILVAAIPLGKALAYVAGAAVVGAAAGAGLAWLDRNT